MFGKEGFGSKDKKGQMVWDNLLPWALAILLLIVGVAAYSILFGKGEGALAFLNDMGVG